jgi:hypothetical protein
MAKVFQMEVAGAYTQAQFDNVAHSLLFADAIQPVYTQTEGGTNKKGIIVTSGVESTATSAASYELLADDSQSETAIDIATGKFVDGNLIAVLATTAEAQEDMRNFVTYLATSGDIHLHIGLCNTTQSQDYTPGIVANNRVIKMMTPSQVQSLGL